jgi:predicted dehydrogenase
MSTFYHLDDHTHPYLAVETETVELEQAIWSALAEPRFDPTLRVGLLGCGWVAGLQLDAYRQSGIDVVALCDRDLAKAQSLAETYFPEAAVFDDVDKFLRWDSFDVADIATHVDVRPELVERALNAGKHVLSQKPFVEDLRDGEKLAETAGRAGRLLAANQNGRWAPHFGAMLAMVDSGLIGEVTSADFQVAWPQDLVVEDMPAFATMADLVLFDFGAHWFDLIGLLAPPGQLKVFATANRRPGQAIDAPTQAQALISGTNFSASLVFRAAERHLEVSQFRVSGTAGVITHQGKHLGGRRVHLSSDRGVADVHTSNNWFRHGMRGSMLELLRAVTTREVPTNSAESALRGLSLCFAATASAATARPHVAGDQLTRTTDPGLAS